MPNEHEELPTSPENLKPSETPPLGTTTLEEMAFHDDRVESWAGYDESKFMHRATAALIERTNVLLRFQQNHDVESIVQRQRVLFEDVISKKFDAVNKRVDKHDTRLDADAEKFEKLSLELAAMRSQCAGIEQLYKRMDDLERELAKLKEGNHGSAVTAQPEAPKLDNPASG